MTSTIAKYVTKKVLGEKIFGETIKNNFGTEDPYFEQVPATRLDGRPSKKTKKRRKALPPGISEHDGKILTKVKRRAYHLDMSLFNCCGIRFGWSSLIGIVPVIGDVLDALMAVMVLRTCRQVEGGLPKDIEMKMTFNILVDFGIGLCPIVGDVLDAVFRANTRNAAVLEKFLRAKGAAALKAHGQAVPVIDPSDPDEYDRQMNEQLGPPPLYTTPTTRTQTTAQNGGQVEPPRRQQGDQAPLAQPQKARVAGERRGGGGWFGFGGKSRQADVESGDMHPADGPLPALPPNTPARTRSTLQKSRAGY